MVDNKVQIKKNSRELFVRQKIGQILKESVPGARVLLYGSHARGENHSDSDWDLLVILPKEKVEPSEYENISYPLYEYGWQLGELFSVKIYSEKEWNKRSFTPFFKNVEKEGIAL